MSEELHNESDRVGDRPDEAAGANARYLWDGSGTPDPFVQRLEALLSPLRHDAGRRASRRQGVRWWVPGLVAAAAVAALVFWARVPMGGSGWTASPLAGAPGLGGSVLDGSRALAVGEWVSTDGASRAVLRRDGLGRVTLDPDGRVRVVKSARSEQRLELARGRISATVVAPPKLFFVDTPAATAIDMGCAYTLGVAENGDGMLEVTSGWVELVGPGGLRSRVPAGVVCAIRAGSGPGTPFRRDASGALIEAVARFDGGSEEAVEGVLAAAGPEDGLTLWHLLPRTSVAMRERIASRLAALVPVEDVDVRAAVDLDGAALERWWSGVLRVW